MLSKGKTLLPGVSEQTAEMTYPSTHATHAQSAHVVQAQKYPVSFLRGARERWQTG